MKDVLIAEIMQGMLGCLNNEQLQCLQNVLEHSLLGKEITETNFSDNHTGSNAELLASFLAAKRIEGKISALLSSNH